MDFEKFAGSLICAVVFAVVVGLGALSYKAITATGNTTYCYTKVEMSSSFPVYNVYANIEWREDRLIAAFPSYDDAQRSLETCPIGK